MKKIFLLSAIAISSFIYNTANAQIGVQFHINLGGRPAYVEPAPVYNDADYYYLPEVAAYYSVNQHCYYYNDGYNWVSAAYLPGRYHDYDWQHSRRYAVNESRPYLHDDVYRSRYHGAFEGRPNWANHDGRDNRVYADRDGRGNYQNNNRWNDNRGYQPQQQRNDQNHGYGMAQPQQRNDHFQQQPQQGDHGRDNGGNQQQNNRNQGQHNDHDARGNNDRGGRSGRFSS